MTTDLTVSDAPTGAVEQQQVQAMAAGAGEAVATPATPAPTFTAEQQAHIDKLLSERLKREREKQQAAVERAKADAEAKALAEQGEYKALFEKAQAEAQATAARLAQMEHDQQRREAAQAAGIPQLWERLRGESPEDLSKDALALAAMMQPAQPANGQRTAATMPTPAAQGTKGLTPEEKRARAVKTF